MLRRLTCAVFGKKVRPDLIRNHDIIFDVVRIIDKKGLFVGEMATSEGIQLAKAKGLDLILVDFKSDPPLCQISDDSIQQSPEGQLLDSQGYSFDPTLRPATIRFSAGIDELELERKIDILRKHLLEKRRCEVIVYLKEKQTLEPEKVRDLLVRILRDCQDVSKSPDYVDAGIEAGEVKMHLWPCNSDQTEQLQEDLIEIASQDLHDDEPALPKKGHPRKFRTIRSRVDPRLLIYEKHNKPSESQ